MKKEGYENLDGGTEVIFVFFLLKTILMILCFFVLDGVNRDESRLYGSFLVFF